MLLIGFVIRGAGCSLDVFDFRTLSLSAITFSSDASFFVLLVHFPCDIVLIIQITMGFCDSHTLHVIS